MAVGSNVKFALDRAGQPGPWAHLHHNMVRGMHSAGPSGTRRGQALALNAQIPAKDCPQLIAAFECGRLSLTSWGRLRNESGDQRCPACSCRDGESSCEHEEVQNDLDGRLLVAEGARVLEDYMTRADGKRTEPQRDNSTDVRFGTCPLPCLPTRSMPLARRFAWSGTDRKQ